jgi:predicted nucleotidyltransferase
MATTIVPPELLDSVVAYFHPQRIILFGSLARGEAGPDSDIDLLVVVAEVAASRIMFKDILMLIARLRAPPALAGEVQGSNATKNDGKGAP